MIELIQEFLAANPALRSEMEVGQLEPAAEIYELRGSPQFSSRLDCVVRLAAANEQITLQTLTLHCKIYPVTITITLFGVKVML